VQEAGESDFLPGERVDSKVYRDASRALVMEGKKPAEGRPEIMGITKASLATDSWLSAASFQETTRVLTEAAIESRSDSLLGLKENIIIGKLIPAGTGMAKYRDVSTSAPEYQPMEFWSSGDDDETGDLADLLAERMAGDVVSPAPIDLDEMAALAEAAAEAAMAAEMVAGAGDLAESGEELPDAQVIELPVNELSDTEQSDEESASAEESQ
jgi:hypothetical protein